MPKWLRCVLRLLKHECESHERCCECPLYLTLHTCLLRNITPEAWDVDEEE